LQFSNSTKAGGRFALGLLFFLILNFMNAFAFTYAYTLPIMRSMGWLVFLAGGLTAAWGLASSGPLKSEMDVDEGAFQLALATLGAFVIVLVSVWPTAVETMPLASRRFATFNIHYGYDGDWHTTLAEAAAAITESGADVVALQEVDTGRMTSYSTDNAYYLARTLHMNVYYLPTVEHLTGIAVLYKGEAVRKDARLLASRQEQTGMIEVVLPWGQEQVHAYGIWMGLSSEDTLRQAEQALEFIAGNSPATLGGDFNSQVDDPEIQTILSAGFVDPFSELGQFPAPPTSPAIDPQSRIDFVLLRGLEPNRAFVSESLASDHRMVVVEVNSP
jgi:endonuclease/exonuclease/phosphatase family metal-dependent hydrolase